MRTIRVFLKECKYIEKKLIRYINDNLSDLSSCEDFDEEYLSGYCFQESNFKNVLFRE